MKHARKVNMDFQYTPAASTDIRKTLNKERRRLAEIAEREARMPRATVRAIKEKKA